MHMRAPEVGTIGRVARGVALAAIVATVGSVAAGEVAVRHVRALAGAAGEWHFDVTLEHADSGWEHYADAWRVVAEDGAVIATRTLYHPHVAEQPFTRGLGAIRAAGSVVWVEARDTVHGWSADRVRVDLTSERGERYEVVR